jgi:hypothetical protein
MRLRFPYSAQVEVSQSRFTLVMGGGLSSIHVLTAREPFQCSPIYRALELTLLRRSDWS